MNKNILKSIGAVLGGIVVIFAVTHLTDFVLERTEFMKLPFSANPLWLMIMVTIYRNVYIILGGYAAAKLAPRNPMRHAVILALIGFVLGILGAAAMWHEPPHWYPIALVILGLPSALLGGFIGSRK